MKTWFTRRDLDGRTLLVEVELGVEGAALSKGQNSHEDNERFSGAPATAKEASRRSHGERYHHGDPFWSFMHRPLYVHPHSAFMRIWEALFLVVSLYFTMLAPLRIALPRLWPNAGLLWLEILCTSTLFVDLVLRCFIAYEEDDENLDGEDDEDRVKVYSSAAADAHLVVSPRRIAARFLRTRFAISLLSALPIDLIVLSAVGSEGLEEFGGAATEYGQASSAAYAGLLRAAAFSNVLHYFAHWDWKAVHHTLLERIAKSIMIGGIGAHWLACGWIYVARLAEGAGLPSHLSSPAALAFEAANGGGSDAMRYCRAIYWALTMCSGVGQAEMVPASVAETVFIALTITCATAFFLFTVGTVTSLMSSGDSANAKTRQDLSALKIWMARAGLPGEIRLRVIENFYEQHVTRRGMEDRSLLAELPKFLQHEVAMFLNKDIVSSAALFRGCSATLVASLVEHLHPHRCLPLDSVVRKGDVGDELYLVKRGLFEVLNEDDTVHRMLGAGSYFGEVALLCQVHRTMTVRAVTHALVFVMDREPFLRLSSEYPADFRQLRLAAASRYRSNPKPSYFVPPSQFESHGLIGGHGSLAKRKRRHMLRVQVPHFLEGVPREVAAAQRPPAANKSKPLAFLPRGDPELARVQSKVVQIRKTQAEVLSVAIDEQVVAKLLAEAGKAPRHASIQLQDAYGPDVDGALVEALGIRQSVESEHQKASRALEHEAGRKPSLFGGLGLGCGGLGWGGEPVEAALASPSSGRDAEGRDRGASESPESVAEAHSKGSGIFDQIRRFSLPSSKAKGGRRKSRGLMPLENLEC